MLNHSERIKLTMMAVVAIIGINGLGALIPDYGFGQQKAIADTGTCTDADQNGYCDEYPKTRCTINVVSGKCHIQPEW